MNEIEKDKQFLDNYDINQYDRPSIAADVAVFSIGRKLIQKKVMQNIRPHCFFRLLCDRSVLIGRQQFWTDRCRERTQILMDVANKEGGFVVGTGDLSELALV